MISTDIDLTVEALFASDYDKNLLLREHWQYYNKNKSHFNLSDTRRMMLDHLTDGLPASFGLPMFTQDKYNEVTTESQFYTYVSLFDSHPPRCEDCEVYEDPYFEYWVYQGIYCDHCDTELNAFNRSDYYIGECESCYEKRLFNTTSEFTL